jgi:hypothetical protein
MRRYPDFRTVPEAERLIVIDSPFSPPIEDTPQIRGEQEARFFDSWMLVRVSPFMKGKSYEKMGIH